MTSAIIGGWPRDAPCGNPELHGGKRYDMTSRGGTCPGRNDKGVREIQLLLNLSDRHGHHRNDLAKVVVVCPRLLVCPLPPILQYSFITPGLVLAFSDSFCLRPPPVVLASVFFHYYLVFSDSFYPRPWAPPHYL